MNPMIRVHDLATNQIIDREMTNDELIALNEQQNKMKAKEEAKAKTEAETEAAKQALLDKLGITADEAKLLLG
jgi:hypothetical protein